jgi:hypothetical protein
MPPPRRQPRRPGTAPMPSPIRPAAEIQPQSVGVVVASWVTIALAIIGLIALVRWLV